MIRSQSVRVNILFSAASWCVLYWWRCCEGAGLGVMGWVLCLVLLCPILLAFASHNFPFWFTPGSLGRRLYSTGCATAAWSYFEGSSITLSHIEFGLRPAQWKGLQAMYALIQDYHLQHPLGGGRGPIYCVLIAVSLSGEKGVQESGRAGGEHINLESQHAWRLFFAYGKALKH